MTFLDRVREHLITQLTFEELTSAGPIFDDDEKRTRMANLREAIRFLDVAQQRHRATPKVIRKYSKRKQK